ncbi:hypothetical protein BJV82DRAFT_671316 [Fennellomyces sp. T-0311]|nr:hypothetical protein BJV82DRAFT_671316 [Fennellomyces sp. T-0311]
MGEIHGDFETYIQLIDQKVKLFTTAINEVEDLCCTYSNQGPRVISRTSKLHILHHLQHDLVRFATAIHYESEKGEQFNKFIHEHIFLTNRHNPSRDVLTFFGRQFMFRHIIEGGYWDDNDTHINAGEAILQYMDTHKDFTETYLGKDREYADNNTACKDFKKGVAGFFVDCETSVYILGQIEDIITQDNTNNILPKFDILNVSQRPRWKSHHNPYRTATGFRIFTGELLQIQIPKAH